MKKVLNCLAFATLLLSFATVAYGQAPNLGTAANFVLLTTNGAITNTGITHLTGHVGSNVGESTGFGNVDGVMHNQDPASAQATANLNARVNLSKQVARDNYNKKIEMLEKRNNELKAKLESLQDRTAEEWNEFKKEFNHDMSELGEAFEDLTKNNVK